MTHFLFARGTSVTGLLDFIFRDVSLAWPNGAREGDFTRSQHTLEPVETDKRRIVAFCSFQDGSGEQNEENTTMHSSTSVDKIRSKEVASKLHTFGVLLLRYGLVLVIAWIAAMKVTE